MNSQTIKALIDAGAIKSVSIIANGSTVHIDIITRAGGSNTASTLKGTIKTWRSIDSAAKWLRNLGIGNAKLDISRWTPEQQGLLL